MVSPALAWWRLSHSPWKNHRHRLVVFIDIFHYKYYKRLYTQLYLYIHISNYIKLYIHIYIWSILGIPHLWKHPDSSHFKRSSNFSLASSGHGLHNCHLAGDCFDTSGHLKEWEKMGNNPGRGRKRDKEAWESIKAIEAIFRAATLAICLATCSYH